MTTQLFYDLSIAPVFLFTPVSLVSLIAPVSPVALVIPVAPRYRLVFAISIKMRPMKKFLTISHFICVI